MPKATIKPADFATLYEGFTAPVSRFDCGRKCAPLNGGEPVCCSTQNAVPVVHKVEFDLLKTRTDLWSKFKPYDYATRQIVAELTSDCMAIHCKGARHCERDNRTIACRGFPFYPYLTRETAVRRHRHLLGVRGPLLDDVQPRDRRPRLRRAVHRHLRGAVRQGPRASSRPTSTSPPRRAASIRAGSAKSRCSAARASC